MFRINGEGATAQNLFTEGDPANAIPATVVTADWANDVQEEIVKPIEEMGLALTEATRDQLYKSLLELHLRGGRKTPASHTLLNDTANDAVANFPALDKRLISMRVAFYYIERKTDTQSVTEAGILFCRYNSRDDNWKEQSISFFDDSETVFTIDDANTDAAVLQATTQDLSGTSYNGTLNMTQIFEIRI